MHSAGQSVKVKKQIQKLKTLELNIIIKNENIKLWKWFFKKSKNEQRKQTKQLDTFSSLGLLTTTSGILILSNIKVIK
jgi:hypothetical protein